jgi:hypothetical protein
MAWFAFLATIVATVKLISVFSASRERRIRGQTLRTLAVILGVARQIPKSHFCGLL